MGNLGSIITKKNGMFVSADENGNTRTPGEGNPIVECSFIAAPNSIKNNIKDGVSYKTLSDYLNDIINVFSFA